MLQSDTSPIFPECPTFGFTVEPQYLVKIVRREGGFERRDRKWSRPLLRFSTVPLGQQSRANIEAALRFWHAMGGAANMFRFLDYTDFQSCGLDATPSATDQPLTFIAGSPGGYQLIKRYSDTGSGLYTDREITRPIGSSIRVANDSGVEQASTRWLLDEATGLLQTLPSFVGTPATWGGEFYVPVRFDSEFPVEITNHRVHSVSFSLLEVREALYS